MKRPRILWLPNRFSPGCNCCGGGFACTQCNSGTTPANVIVTVPALTNGVCTSCAGLAGNYTLPQVGPGDPCHYFKTYTSSPGPGCWTNQGFYTLQAINLNLYIYANRTEFVWTWAYGGSVFHNLVWYQTHTAPIDCDFSSYSLPWQRSDVSGPISAVCTTSNAVTLTAA